jgi:hypothetical protein
MWIRDPDPQLEKMLDPKPWFDFNADSDTNPTFHSNVGRFPKQCGMGPQKSADPDP